MVLIQIRTNILDPNSLQRLSAEEKSCRSQGKKYFTMPLKIKLDILIADNRTYQFKTSYFGTMALFQDAHINMPFQSWEIRPHKTNSALFTIIAAISEIEIEIKVGTLYGHW